MTDTEIQEKISEIKAKVKSHRILSILIGVGLLFIVGLFFLTGGRSNRTIRDLQKENKILQKQMDSLNTRYSLDSLDRANIIVEQEEQRQERQGVLDDIRRFSQSLNKFKNQYEKVPTNYTNVSDDSLLRLFKRRFNY